jgi:hypothetical protein
MFKAPSSTSSSEDRPAVALVNRCFVFTCVAIMVGAELLLRATPQLDMRLFRALYGNSLAMFLTVDARLDGVAEDVRVLALGDSLAMTQFQADLFAQEGGLEVGEVFNAAYLGMSFPSQEDMLRRIGIERFTRLRHVIYFLNPRRLSTDEVPNTDVLRIGVPPADGRWKEIWETKRLAPLFDGSRLYGLSSHLLFSAWRSLLDDARSWDHVELLGPRGGVAWPHPRPSDAEPVYPYAPLDVVSPARLAEMRRVIRLLRSTGAEVAIVPSALHPSIDPFASGEARARYEAAVVQLATETGSRYLPDLVAGFRPADERAYCDYGHVNAAGGEAFTRHLLRQRGTLLGGV